MLRLNPTSGVDLDNAGDFLMNGAASVGLVAPLFDPPAWAWGRLGAAKAGPLAAPSPRSATAPGGARRARAVGGGGAARAEPPGRRAPASRAPGARRARHARGRRPSEHGRAGPDAREREHARDPVV